MGAAGGSQGFETKSEPGSSLLDDIPASCTITLPEGITIPPPRPPPQPQSIFSSLLGESDAHRDATLDDVQAIGA